MTAAGIALWTPTTAAAQGQCLPPKGVYTAQAEFANATYLFSGRLFDSVAARDARDVTLGNVTRGLSYAGAAEQYVLTVTRAMLTEPPQCPSPAKKRRAKRR
jgi:hypothetical protein